MGLPDFSPSSCSSACHSSIRFNNAILRMDTAEPWKDAAPPPVVLAEGNCANEQRAAKFGPRTGFVSPSIPRPKQLPLSREFTFWLRTCAEALDGNRMAIRGGAQVGHVCQSIREFSSPGSLARFYVGLAIQRIYGMNVAKHHNNLQMAVRRLAVRFGYTNSSLG